LLGGSGELWLCDVAGRGKLRCWKLLDLNHERREDEAEPTN
jgi:hypothetical protein